MSLHYYPDGFDVHTGGVDLVFPHHEDEIAQSEPVAGPGFVHYWIHGEFLEMEGRKMAKSAGNIVRITSLEEQGYDPLAFRYLYLFARYRSKLHFNEETMDGAARGLDSVRQRASELPPATSPESTGAREFEAQFRAALDDDLNLTRVPDLLQKVLRSDLEGGEKRALLERWDEVLQLDLTRAVEVDVPAEVTELAERREHARRERQWETADRLREEIAALGWSVEDGKDGFKLRPAGR
jgi:cysteinyl-tRNA synthetase